MPTSTNKLFTSLLIVYSLLAKTANINNERQETAENIKAKIAFTIILVRNKD